MAFPIKKPLTVVRYEGGKPIFNTPYRQAEPESPPVHSASPAPSAYPKPKTQASGTNKAPVCTPDGAEPITGYFTVVLRDDSWVTLRLRRQPEEARFAPGQILASYLFGRNNETDYRRCAVIDGKGRAWLYKEFRDNRRLRTALAAVLGDQEQAGKAYAQETRRCWRCGLHLSTPESLERLMGDDCWRKSR